MNKDIKVFVADVDGTLRSRTRPLPGPLTISAFEEMHKQGYLLGIASGRPLWQSLKDHYKEWKLSFQFDFLIGMNGGEIWTKENDQKRTYHPLTRDQLEQIVTTFKDIKGINPFVYREGCELTRYVDDEIIQSSLRHSCRFEACTSDADLYSEDTGKILYRCETEEIALYLEKLGKEKFSDEIACFRTSPKLVELQNSIVSKGSGITTYCKTHNIPLESVIAFGDAENDIEMLKVVGHSVALKDGMPNVKAITNDITEYDAGEDGVGHYLWNHLLKESD
jgi:Cof subfamily protein (haloacid dehalogenase superfamily)